MKTCIGCGASKPLDSYCRHPGMADGRLGRCKVCHRAAMKSLRDGNLDEARARDRERSKSPARIEHAKRTLVLHRQRHPEKARARWSVSNAIRDGKLARAPCERCGAARAEAHHPDYSKPLNVKWLCAGCHREEHRPRI